MAFRLIYNVGRRHEKERVYRHMEPEYDDNEFRDRFRFTKNSLQFITDLIEPNLCRPTLRSHAIPAFTQVQLALRYFASGSPMRVIGDTMGYHISSVSRAVRDVSSALCNISQDFIQWPETQQQKNKIRDGFYDVAHFPGVVGTIDGTHVRIQAPSGDNEYAFVNRKGFHSINVQGVCDHTGKFLNVVANWPGSCHDSFIFKTSNLGRYMETRHRGYDMDGVLLGDSGYPCKRYIVTPYLRPNSESQVRYNKAHVKTRAIVERCFGWWKRRFNILHGEIRTKPEKAVKIITACAVLHNIALKLREQMEDDNQEVNDVPVIRNHVDERRQVREHITRTFFS
ncbi:putative nuclease HARBI1 [Mytilus californianus]|nr:putative nuclease HARBI1 [Mytilus californianus]